MNETEKMQLWADYRKSVQLLKKEGVNAQLLIAAIEFIYGKV